MKEDMRLGSYFGSLNGNGFGKCFRGRITLCEKVSLPI